MIKKKNETEPGPYPNTTLVTVTQDYKVIVDTEDWTDWLDQYRWYLVKYNDMPYAATGIRSEGKRVSLHMHRLVADVSSRQIKVKYKDRPENNILDNRKSNLIKELIVDSTEAAYRKILDKRKRR